MGKEIKHMGMSITEEEHKRWHKEHPEITPEQHEDLMKKMGISEEEDEEWHKTHEISEKNLMRHLMSPGREPVNPFAIGGGFLDYCIKQGWLVREGKGRNAKYYVTGEGREQIRKFDIKI